MVIQTRWPPAPEGELGILRDYLYIVLSVMVRGVDLQTLRPVS